MPNIPDSDIYPTTTFQNPLLMPAYIRTNDPYSISIQARDDWLLSVFIEQLNNEIIDEIDEFKEYKKLLYDIFWKVRVFGWCVIQPYDETFRVFSSLEWEEWIKETNEETDKLERVGVRVHWTDDLGNIWKDDLYFDDVENDNGEKESKCFLIKWQDGNGRPLPHQPALSAFCLPDLSFGVLALDIHIRQITDTLTFAATNPFFYHLRYGDSISPDQRNDLVIQMSYAGASKALGAKSSTLEEIIPIENGAVNVAIEALDEQIRFFASVTRLPLCYYLAERQTGGLGDTGEHETEIKILKKKSFILQHFIPALEPFFQEQLGQSIAPLYDYYTNKVDELETKKDEMMNQSNDEKGNNNEERTKGNDKEE